jgi:hypothetical protein
MDDMDLVDEVDSTKKKSLLSFRSFLSFASLVLVVLALIYLFKSQPDLGLNKITTSIKSREEWAISLSPELSAVLDEIFSQPFTFLASGTQSYAFVSQDQQYVLKFFKMKHLTPEAWLKYARRNKSAKREQKVSQTFGMLKAAYQELKDETGLVFVHLNKSKDLKKQVRLISRNGKEYALSLEAVPFILQKRAELIYPHLAKLMDHGEKLAATRCLHSFLNLIWTRELRGFVDRDQSISKNYGFIGEKAVQIDIGNLARKEWIEEERQPQQEIDRVVAKTEPWIRENYPELLADLHKFKSF